MQVRRDATSLYYFKEEFWFYFEILIFVSYISLNIQTKLTLRHVLFKIKNNNYDFIMTNAECSVKTKVQYQVLMF